MKSIDYNYIAIMINSFSGVPIRIYKDNKLAFYYSSVNLIKDPISIYQSDIFKLSDHIGYFFTAHFSYYGIVNSNEYKIVIGPTRQVADSTSELLELACQLDISKDDIESFIIAMQGINHISLEHLMQLLCFLNYILNNEKYSLQDILINNSLQEHFKESMNYHEAYKIFFNDFSEQDITIHNTYNMEQTLMNMIQKGDYISLSELLENSSALNIGIMADNQLRQLKNIFIVIATLASRSAIKGGMLPDYAFKLSDNYILKCELLNDYHKINNLRHFMIMDFAKRVNQLHKGAPASKLISDVSNYINRHMSEPITVEAMAKEFFMSRSYLSKRFKAESNITLTDFILNKKTEEAKHLLLYTNKSLTAISLCLGFSSPEHFSRVFRKYAAISPNEYRKKHINGYNT